jgi:hypothetical protein
MLRLDLAQAPRLLAIEDNTRERLAEARQMQWLGEVAALEEKPAPHRREEAAGRPAPGTADAAQDSAGALG